MKKRVKRSGEVEEDFEDLLRRKMQMGRSEEFIKIFLILRE